MKKKYLILGSITLLLIFAGVYFAQEKPENPSIESEEETEEELKLFDFSAFLPDEEFDPFAEGEKPACPDPFVFELPIDIDLATSVLYPGQERGGDYKAHGGFRFDNSDPDEVTVTAPYDAYLILGGRYTVDGEVQYTFDFAHPCGVRYRLGHLLKLSEKFQKIADEFPLLEEDSRTTGVYPYIEVKQGEVVATAVGFESYQGNINTFMDWGVYDYRQKNEASKDPTWLAEHSYDTYIYGVCWFDWISAENRTKVLALPSSDSVSGKKSDYCF